MSKTKKAQTIQQRREQRRLQELKAKQLRKAAEETDDEIDIEEELDVEELDESEELPEEEPEVVTDEVQKDMSYDGATPMPMMGPTSWEEKDAMDMAAEQASEVREISWAVSDLVRNILCDTDMTPAEKAKAIQEVGTGFEDRVSTVFTEPVEKDLDLLTVKAILGYDKRHSGLLERSMGNLVDMFDKAVLTTAKRKKLSAGQFALPSKRKYPIHDKAHVRNALSRAAQQIKAGGAGAADAKAALPAIRAAAKRMGIGVSRKEHNAIFIEKDAQGYWRWVGWVSNNFEDRSGDIIIEAAHREYVDWVNKDLENNAPVFTSCHAPETVRQNPVDFVGVENGFLVMSGKLTEDEAENLLKVAEKTDIGMSHTSWGLRNIQDPKQIIKYRCFEVTDLPVECADNPFTTLETFTKEVDMDQLAYLSALLGSKEKAERALSMKTKLAKEALEAAGVESKEATPPEQPEATPPAQSVTDTLDMERIKKELDIPGLEEFVKQARDAMEKVPVLEAAIKELTKPAEEKVAEMIEAPTRMAWSVRPTQKEENIIKDDDPLKQEKPKSEETWLSDLFNTKPIPAENKQ